MRCIEIPSEKDTGFLQRWLIETWDVLKWSRRPANSTRRAWLIETWDVLKWASYAVFSAGLGINRNMRCIEMMIEEIKKDTNERINRNMRCIEIYKFGVAMFYIGKINRNMRCIEIHWLCHLSLYLYLD